MATQDGKASARVTRSQTKQSRIALRNQAESPLLRLPPELRNRIYRYVLGGNIYKFLLDLHDRPWVARSWRHIPSGENAHVGLSPYSADLGLGLLRVCRQLYHETAILPYSLNTFSCNDYSIHANTPTFALQVLFAECTPSQLQAIRKVELVTRYWLPLFHPRKESIADTWSFLSQLAGLQTIDIVFNAYQVLKGPPKHEDFVEMLKSWKSGVEVTTRKWGEDMESAVKY